MRILPILLLTITLLPALTPAAGAQQDAPPEPAAPGDAAGDEAAAGEAESEAESEPEVDEDRVSFDVRLPAERGGGRVKGTAGAFDYQEDRYLLASGGVELEYQDLKLEAERARLDLDVSLLTAEGEVVLDEGPQRLTGDTLEYDLSTRTGKVTQATAYVSPDYYFSGSQIAKVAAETFTVDDGVFTACDQEVPSWSIHLRDARVTVDKYARIHHARLKFKSVPMLYVPYMLWPATTNRASGFLVPRPGYSARRGANLDLAYFKTLGRSADTTFYLDLSSEEFFGFGNEIRYRPSEGTRGMFRAYVLSQPDPLPDDTFAPVFEPGRPDDELRWKVELVHDSKDLWAGFRGVVNLRQYSDFDYLQDFERNVGRQTRSFIYSNAFLTKNFGQHSLNLMLDQRERILVQPQQDRRRQLPELEYRLRPTQLGKTPLYLSIDSGMHYFSVEQSQGQLVLDEQYGRAHIQPTLSVPLSTLPWLSAKVDLGGRATYYTESLRRRFDDDGQPIPDEDGTPIGTEFGGGTLSRVVPETGVQIVGPVFTRIFEKKLGRFAKFKHIIEPRFGYIFRDEFDRQGQIFRFDEIDGLSPANAWGITFVNRLMGKPEDPNEGGAIEIASLELRQAFSLDDDKPGQRSSIDPTVRSDEGPFFATLRVNPSTDTSVKMDVTYNTLFSELQALSFSGGTKIGRHRLGLTWFTNWQVEDTVTRSAGDKTSEQLRFFAGISVLPHRLSLDAEVSYDTLAKEFRQQRYFVNWQSQCYSWRLEYRESLRGSILSPIEDRDIRFALTLKNVGTFLDLHESF